MIENAHPCHRLVHGSGTSTSSVESFMVHGSRPKASAKTFVPSINHEP
jgi:hypothetical protein